MPHLPTAAAYQQQKDRADHLAQILAAILCVHGPLTVSAADLLAQIVAEPQLYTTYSSVTDTYTLRVK